MPVRISGSHLPCRLIKCSRVEHVPLEWVKRTRGAMDRDARGRSGTVYGMHEGTLNLPDDLSRELQRIVVPCGCSRYTLIREAVRAGARGTALPGTRLPLFVDSRPTAA